MPDAKKNGNSEGQVRGKIKIRAMVFDYGNVLSLEQAADASGKLARLCGVPLEVFTERFWKARLAYDRADLDGRTYWESVAGKALAPHVLDELYAVDSASWGNPNLSMLSWVDQLRSAGIRVAVLSNMPLEIRLFLVKNREWLSVFDPMIFSCDLRLVKPEEAIYKECLGLVQLTPEEILFLDDKQVNVDGARKVGMHSLVFESVEKTLPLVGDQFDLPLLDEVIV